MIDIEANGNVEETTEHVAKASKMGFTKILSKTYGRLKAAIKGTTKELEIIRSRPLTAIDEFFGNKGRQIYNATFGKLASAYSKFETEMKGITNKLNKAEEKLSKKFRGNKLVKEKFKIKYYQLQREFEANPGSNEVHSGDAFIEATIADENVSNFYNEESKQLLREIQKEFAGKTSEQILNTFSPETKEALKVMDTINDSVVPKALFVAGVIRGENVKMYNHYTHHNVIADRSQRNEATRRDAFTSPGVTKAGTVNERTEGVKPISFDPFYDASTTTRGLLLDYHMSPVNREVLRTTKRLQLEFRKGTKPQQAATVALNEAVIEVLQNVFDANAQEYSSFDTFTEKVKKLSYQATLASAPRMVAEAMSNFGFAMFAAPGAFTSGATKYFGVAKKGTSIRILDNVGSTQTQKLFERDVSGSKHVESVISQGKGKQARAVSEFQEGVNEVIRKAGKYSGVSMTASAIDKLADTMISSPDKAIARPLWFGAFAEAFKKNAGVEVDYSKLEAGDQAYMTEHKEAILKARIQADELSVMAGATNNPFSGILKLQQKKGVGSSSNAYRVFSGYLQRFLLFEYQTAKTGVLSLIGSGHLTRRQGAGLIAGAMTRMTLYGTVYALFSNLLAEALGVGDEEEEDYWKMAKQDVVGSALTLFFGRNLTAFPKIPINAAIEGINEKVVGDDYDPFKDSIVWSQIGKQDFRHGKSFADWLVKLAGPYGTPLKGFDYVWKDVAKLSNMKEGQKKEEAVDKLFEKLAIQGLGHSGLIPFFKDINKIYKKQQYLESQKKKKKKRKKGWGDDFNTNWDVKWDDGFDSDW